MLKIQTTSVFIPNKRGYKTKDELLNVKGKQSQRKKRACELKKYAVDNFFVNQVDQSIFKEKRAKRQREQRKAKRLRKKDHKIETSLKKQRKRIKKSRK